MGKLTAQGFDPTSVDHTETNSTVSSPDDLLNATNRSGTPLSLAGLSVRLTDGGTTYYLVPCYGGPDRVPYYLDEDSWPAGNDRAVLWISTSSGPVPFLLHGANEPNALLVAERPGSERLDLDGDGSPDVDLSGLAALRLGLNLPGVSGTFLYMLYIAVGGVLKAKFHVVYKDGSENVYTRLLYGWTEETVPEPPLVLYAISPLPGAKQRIPVGVYVTEVPLDPARPLDRLYVEIEPVQRLPFHPPCEVWILALTIEDTTGDYLLIEGPNLYYTVNPGEYLLNARFYASDVETSGGSMTLKLHVRTTVGAWVTLRRVRLEFLDRNGTPLDVTPTKGDLETEALESLKEKGIWDSEPVTLTSPSGSVEQPALITITVEGSAEISDNHGKQLDVKILTCVPLLTFDVSASQTGWTEEMDTARVDGIATLAPPGNFNAVHWMIVVRDWAGYDTVVGEGVERLPGGLPGRYEVPFEAEGSAALLDCRLEVRVYPGYRENDGFGWDTGGMAVELRPRSIRIENVRVEKVTMSDSEGAVHTEFTATARIVPNGLSSVKEAKITVSILDPSGREVAKVTETVPPQDVLRGQVSVHLSLDGTVPCGALDVTLECRDGLGVSYRATERVDFHDVTVEVAKAGPTARDGNLEGEVEVAVNIPADGTLEVLIRRDEGPPEWQPVPVRVDGRSPATSARLTKGSHRISVEVPPGVHEVASVRLQVPSHRHP